MNKRIISLACTGAILAGAAGSLPVQNAGLHGAAADINYATALQMSLYFYECQQAGHLPAWNRVEWRADATTDDFIDGGWYDAGDHVKFNLPMAYSASMLAWGLYQYGDGVQACGEMENYVNNLSFVLDYLAACDLGDEIVFQVGNGQEDHTWWGPVELYSYGMGESSPYTRPYYKASEGCSAVFGEMAAALAAGYCALDGKIGEGQRSAYLEHAENIFKIASTSPSDTVYNDSDASGFYRSSHFYDELFYAANWLYKATGDKAYLNKAESYIPNLGKELGTSELKYSWSQCWDDVQQGGLLLYAQNTKDSTYISRVQKHLDYWCSGQQLDGGLCYVDTWGCLRYANNIGFLAAVACDTLFSSDAALCTKYKTLYENQINYSLGDNPDHQCYVVGHCANSPENPHHRTAHCSWKNALETPETNRHVLYGALVGGPDNSGNYEDDRGNYINNEVATDYNAGFTALLCKMVSAYGGETDAAFPEPEVRTPEFFVEAKATSDAGGVNLSLKFTNQTAWPARVEDNLSYRYYMDLSEVIAAGSKPEDVVIRCDRDQSAMYSGVTPAQISGIQHYSGDIYYVEVTYPDGRAAIPISEGRYQCETMLALVFPNYGKGWDSTNDYSCQDIEGAEDNVMTDKITVYQNGVLLYGIEPDGTAPVTTAASTSGGSTGTTTGTETALPGDANADGKVQIADVVTLNKYLVGAGKLTARGAKNADMDDNGRLDAVDAVLLKRIFVS